MIGVLITDGGTHSAEKWAEATASHIVDIANHVAGEKRAAAVKLQAAIIDILERHHATVQSGEKAKIAEHSHDRLAHDNDPSHHLEVDEVISEIIAASVGTPWEADFAYPGEDIIENGEVVGRHQSTAEHLNQLLNQHFKTSIHIERSWHADRHSATEQAKTFRAIHHFGE